MPRILYKYLNIRGAEVMIGNKTLQFTNATKLNDPLDTHHRLVSNPNVFDPNGRGLTSSKWWAEKEELDAKNLRDDTWICSLSKVNNSAVMWSHYCDNHTGICIGLDMDKVMKCCPPLFSTIYDKPIEIEVKYQVLLEYPNATDSDGFFYQWQVKAKEWEHEQEVRLVAVKPHPMYAAFTPEQAKLHKKEWDRRDLHHYMPLSDECFESIYFGINTEQDKKENIIQHFRKMQNHKINFYQMRVDDNALRLQHEII